MKVSKPSATKHTFEIAVVPHCLYQRTSNRVSISPNIPADPSDAAEGYSGNTLPTVEPSRKGKGRAIAEVSQPELADPELDLQVAQVLDVLPDHSPEYIKVYIPFLNLYLESSCFVAQ